MMFMEKSSLFFMVPTVVGQAWLIQNFPKNQWFTMTVPFTEPTIESTIPVRFGKCKSNQDWFSRTES